MVVLGITTTFWIEVSLFPQERFQVWYWCKCDQNPLVRSSQVLGKNLLLLFCWVPEITFQKAVDFNSFETDWVGPKAVSFWTLCGPLFGPYIKLTKAGPWSGSYGWHLAQCLAHMEFHKSKNPTPWVPVTSLKSSRLELAEKPVICGFLFMCWHRDMYPPAYKRNVRSAMGWWLRRWVLAAQV